MTQAERMITTAHLALDQGPMGAHWRSEFYKWFVGVGRTKDLSKIKTSCAVFIHGLLHWSGRTDQRADIPGMGIFDGWLEGLTYFHKAWEDSWETDKHGNKSKRQPPPGAICYWAYSKASGGTESHVEMLVFEIEPGKWIVASGGGSPDATNDAALLKGLSTAQIKELNGTVCRMGSKGKDIWAKDKLSRVLVGWWRPEALDGFLPETPDWNEPIPSPVNPRVSDPDDVQVTYTAKYSKKIQRLLSVGDDGKLGKGSYNAFVKKIGREDLVVQ